MTDYVVCIPSYKRAEILKEKTLKMLHENRISPNKIYIYVANKTEFQTYKETIDSSLYNEMIIGKKGLVVQRQFISEKWSDGQPILFIDDDVKSIDLSLSTLFKNRTLDYFIKYAFRACKESKSFIWGLYPVFNPYFRKNNKEINNLLN
jgi:hypothetical protein